CRPVEREISLRFLQDHRCNVSSRLQLMTPHENLFRSILGANGVRTTTANDAILGVQPQLILEPVNELQLASVLRLANDANLTIIPRGGGTKLAWGNPPQHTDAILSTTRLNKILEHAASDLTV